MFINLLIFILFINNLFYLLINLTIDHRLAAASKNDEDDEIEG